MNHTRAAPGCHYMVRVLALEPGHKGAWVGATHNYPFVSSSHVLIHGVNKVSSIGKCLFSIMPPEVINTPSALGVIKGLRVPVVPMLKPNFPSLEHWSKLLEDKVVLGGAGPLAADVQNHQSRIGVEDVIVDPVPLLIGPGLRGVEVVEFLLFEPMISSVTDQIKSLIVLERVLNNDSSCHCHNRGQRSQGGNNHICY